MPFLTNSNVVMLMRVILAGFIAAHIEQGLDKEDYKDC